MPVTVAGVASKPFQGHSFANRLAGTKAQRRCNFMMPR
jgi:hypothetical protein